MSRRWITLLAAVALTLGGSGMALAFHDGGVAYCEGCHTMHNSVGGQAVHGTQFQGVDYLLKGSDQSSTCLNCHAAQPAGHSYHIADFSKTAGYPGNFTPGGDFGWLTITTSDLASYGAPINNPGERHGHNVIATDFNLIQDSTLSAAPGGTYSAANLGCQSCHDPHGRTRIVDASGTMATSAIGTSVLPIGGSGSYGAMPTATEAVGVYRLLGGSGYVPQSYTGGPAFTANPPIAVAPNSYNRAETTIDTRVAYGTGMSEWCANCHTQIHSDTVDQNFIHPASSTAALPATIVNNYNAYVKSGDLTGGVATSYTSLVPYEEGISDRAALALDAVSDGSKTQGPTAGTANVMCLSCHRAHASAWGSMTRWNVNSEFLTLDGDYPGTDAPTTEGQGGQYAMGYTMAQYQAGMYQRPATDYATFQRQLCNKCHAKD